MNARKGNFKYFKIKMKLSKWNKGCKIQRKELFVKCNWIRVGWKSFLFFFMVVRDVGRGLWLPVLFNVSYLAKSSGNFYEKHLTVSGTLRDFANLFTLAQYLVRHNDLVHLAFVYVKMHGFKDWSNLLAMITLIYKCPWKLMLSVEDCYKIIKWNSCIE